MSTTGNRIKEWRLAQGWSLAQLAEKAGTSKAQIDKLEKGERRLTVDWMVRLARPLGRDPRELLPETPAQSLYPRPVTASPAFSALGFGAQLDPLPVRGAARGGKDQQMFLEDGPIDQVSRPPNLAHVKEAYALYVVGQSMIPMYRPGQMLFINPYKPPVAERGVVIVKANGAVLIKEYVAQKPEGLWVREYHPRRREFLIPAKEIASLHAVVGTTEPP